MMERIELNSLCKHLEKGQKQPNSHSCCTELSKTVFPCEYLSVFLENLKKIHTFAITLSCTLGEVHENILRLAKEMKEACNICYGAL